MIKKAKFICVFAVSGLFCADFAMADSLVAKNGVLYYTNTDSLTIDVVPGGPSSCDSTTIPVGGATVDSDIVVSRGYAVVRRGDGTVTPPILIPSGCLADDSLSVDDCIAKANLGAGTLTVPCVDVEDDDTYKIYQAVFEHLGNSPNWRLNSAIPNVRFHN